MASSISDLAPLADIPPKKLAFDLNRQPSLIWEKFWECKRFRIAILYRVRSFFGRFAVESRMACLSLSKLNRIQRGCFTLFQKK